MPFTNSSNGIGRLSRSAAPVFSGILTSVDSGVDETMLISKASIGSAGAVTTGIGSSGTEISTSVGVGHVTLSDMFSPGSMNGRIEKISVSDGTGATGVVTTSTVSDGSISSIGVGLRTLSDWPVRKTGKREAKFSTMIEVLGVSTSSTSGRMTGVAEASVVSKRMTVGWGQVKLTEFGSTAGSIELMDTSSSIGTLIVIGIEVTASLTSEVLEIMTEDSVGTTIGARPVRLKGSVGGKNGKTEKTSPKSLANSAGTTLLEVAAFFVLDSVAVTFFVTVVFFVIETVLIDPELLTRAELGIITGVELGAITEASLAELTTSTGVGATVTVVVGEGLATVVGSGSAASSKPKSPPRIVRKTSIGSKPLKNSPNSLKNSLPSFLSLSVMATSCPFSAPGAGARVSSVFWVSRRLEN